MVQPGQPHRYEASTRGERIQQPGDLALAQAQRDETVGTVIEPTFGNRPTRQHPGDGDQRGVEQRHRDDRQRNEHHGHETGGRYAG